MAFPVHSQLSISLAAAQMECPNLHLGRIRFQLILLVVFSHTGETCRQGVLHLLKIIVLDSQSKVIRIDEMPAIQKYWLTVYIYIEQSWCQYTSLQ